MDLITAADFERSVEKIIQDNADDLEGVDHSFQSLAIKTLKTFGYSAGIDKYINYKMEKVKERFDGTK